MRWIKRIAIALAALVGLVLLIVTAGGGWLWIELCFSLARIDGSLPLPGLAAEVRVDRDALGVPTITGASRIDVARATGFVHAQDRFFQMDLLRRRAAGELAAIVGPGVLEDDRAVRRHQFRRLAQRVVEAAPPEGRALFDAYTEGVNAGLRALRAKPFEYIALRVTPEPWRTEDSVLVILAMYLELQDPNGRLESALGVLHDTVPPALFDFLAPRGTEWDAPIVGGPLEAPPIPGPEVANLRLSPPVAAARSRPEPAVPHRGIGSNNWAVDGAHAQDGAALIASDMHLGLMVPNTWYRVALVWGAGDAKRRLAGVTLPGVPSLVAGSNGDIAWGFTNSYGDWSDLVEIEVDPADPEMYQTPDGPRRFERERETIQVKGGPDVSLAIAGTIWGPVADHDHRGRPRALRWVAHDVEGVNLEMRGLETARTLDDVFAVAATSGIPAQNLVCADAQGHIAWTIIGRIPRRVGFDGRLPGSWADGARRWDGYLRAEEYPRVVDPPSGRIWTANARAVDGAALAVVGDGGYDLGARARQIRDDLFAVERATPLEMLRVQLDDRAVFLSRWRDLLLATLTPEAIAGSPRRAEARRFVEDWKGRAAVESVGFRIVRAFRFAVEELAFEPLTAPCRKADEGFEYGVVSQEEGPLWRLVSERPPHLLDPKFASWDDALRAAVDKALDNVTRDGAPLAEATWGRRNRARIQHPLSLAVPQLGRYLDMPPDPLPGEDIMPRVQGPGYGASERFVVSPGREEQGFFHMPTGQSGHPLSPWYRAGHEAWEHGTPTPFLPGVARHTLLFQPADRAH